MPEWLTDWHWYRLTGCDGSQIRIWGFEKSYGWQGATCIGGLMVTYLRGLHTGEIDETQ